VPVSYARYLANVFHKALKLEGTPLRIDFEQGENPFEVGQRARKRR
jgi:GTP-binding protein